MYNYSKSGRIPGDKPNLSQVPQSIDKVDFETIVRKKFIPFMELYDLSEGVISDGLGNKATIKKDKHGFYKVKITSQMVHRETEEDV